MSGIPVQPVTVTLAELTAIRTTLTERAHELRKRADSRRGTGAEHDRVIFRRHADGLDELAARLSFAVPGEPIEVVCDPADAIPTDIPAGPGRD